MTDYELYHQMRTRGFTENGAKNVIEVKNKYSALYPHYNEYMGNFGFTEEDCKNLMPLILEYIKEHERYVLLYDNMPYENDYVWWLTKEY